MDSLSAQISGLMRLAAAHRTWFVADVFIDVASVKTGSKRLEFNRMINECEYGNLDIILTKSLSRFGCDANEAQKLLEEYEQLGKELSLRKIRQIRRPLNMNY